MKHSVPHDLGQEKAKKAAEAALAQYSQKFAKYSPKTQWVSDNKANISFNIKGITMSGTMEVLANAIEMDLDVPFLFRPFKGQALGIIEGEIKDWIAKAKQGNV
jgi:hypothetical protein